MFKNREEKRMSIRLFLKPKQRNSKLELLIEVFNN